MFSFKTQGREYQFTLGDDGLVHCKDLGIKAETTEALKPLVSAEVKRQKSAPRIPVIILGARWLAIEGYTFGSASTQAERNGYRWVSYKDDGGKTKRRKFSSDSLYLDTPENRLYADSLVTLGQQIANLQDNTQEIKSQMAKIGDEVEEQDD